MVNFGVANDSTRPQTDIQNSNHNFAMKNPTQSGVSPGTGLTR
jgi:hypothetical protein